MSLSVSLKKKKISYINNLQQIDPKFLEVACIDVKVLSQGIGDCYSAEAIISFLILLWNS